MSLRYPRVESEYENALGMDSTSNVATIPQGYVQEAFNADIGLSAGYVKRKGHSLNATWSGGGSRSITGGIEFRPSSLVNEVLLYSSLGEIGERVGTAINNISTGYDVTARPAFVQIDQQALMINGSDAPWLYDGTNVKTLGIAPPVLAPTGASATVVGRQLIAGQSYVFAYTFYNSVTFAESSPRLLGAVTVGGGNNTVTFTGLSTTALPTADTIRFYRTVGGGSQLFLDSEQPAGTSSYSFGVVPDAGLGQPMEEDNGQISLYDGTPIYPTVAQNRLFVKMRRNEVRHSKISQEGPRFESFEATAFVDTEGKFGAADDIVGIGAASDVPIVLKERSVGRLEAIGIPDTLSPVDPVRYAYVEMSDTVSCASHWSQCQVFNELVWLGRDNIYATDGKTVRSVADRLQTTIKNLGFLANQRNRLSAINDTKNFRVMFAVFSSGLASNPDWVLVGDYRRYPEFRWTIYRPGDNLTTLPGLKVGCFVGEIDTSSGHIRVLFGNVEGNNKLFVRNEVDYDEDGAGVQRGIAFRVKTRPYAHGSPINVKLYKDTSFHAKGTGSAYNLTICGIYDLGGTEEDCQNFTLEVSGAIWDTDLWDNAVWGDEIITLKQYDAHRKARFQQLVFKQEGANQPVELLGWMSTGSFFNLS